MRASRFGTWALVAMLPFLHGIFVLAFEMDSNWDLRNYHYYNAYAWVNDRYGHDFLVASVPTFFNPTIDVPFFRVAQLWPARAIGLVLGMVQGLNAIPIFGIAMACLARTTPKGEIEYRPGIAFGLAFLAYFGATMLSLLGTTYYDNIVSLGGLFGLWLIVAARGRLAAGGIWALAVAFAAGALGGLAIGLKLSSAIYGAGLAAAVAAVPAGSTLARLGRVAALGLGAACGFAVTGGHWALHLWRLYANPVFPFYNHIFRSPWALFESYKHVFYLPVSATEWLTRIFAFPLAYAIDNSLTGEVEFQDHRILAAYALLIAAAAFWWRRRRAGAPEPEASLARDAAAPVIAYWAAAYVAWIFLFGIYRYAITLEMLGPLVIVLAWDRLPLSVRWRASGAVLTIAAVVLTMQPADWGRAAWTARWVTTDAPPIARPEASIVLLTGHEPYGFIVPAYPPSVRFLRIDGGFTNPAQTEVRFNDEMRKVIAAHTGDFHALTTRVDHISAETNLGFYGLTVDFASCREFYSSIGNADYQLCPARRR